MEKHEPSLVPEWLRSTRNGSSRVGSKNHILSSSARSDSSLSHNSKSDVDSVQSPFLDRSSSTNARRGFSNGSNKNAYSNFNVQKSGHRDKYWSRKKDMQSYMDRWDHDTSLPFGTFLNGRDQEQLRRSHSMATRKDHLAQGFTMGLKNGKNINVYDINGKLPGPSPAKSVRKPGFEKGFPSLRTDERNGGPNVVRISSPGLSLAVQSLSIGNPGLTAGEGWTSALAEVPNVIEKSSSVSHANVGTSVTGQTCCNMAESLVQAPRIGTPTQGSSKVQSLEDQALKQTRHLLPVVPSAPNGPVLTKPTVRSGEIKFGSVRNTHQQSSMLFGNIHSNPGSQIKPDATKKLVVLKPARENGVSAVKESGGPSGITNSLAAASQMTAASPIQLTTSHANVGTSVTGQTCCTMAESLVKAPRIGAPPQGSSKVQSLEDQALKQTRQLIPIVPSAPNGPVLTKPTVRSSEIIFGSLRNIHQQSSMLLGNLHSNPGSQIKPDATKKLVVIKPARENGVSAVKESRASSGITNSLAAASLMTAASPTQLTADVRSTNNSSKLRGSSVNMLAEKKLSMAQIQSRSAFYSALKKKKSTNISTDPSKPISTELLASDSSSVQAAERDDIVMERVEKVSEVAEKNSGFESADRPDEKEAEFLKSLGWEENSTEEDEPLTEEEINAFIEQCKKLKPSLVEKMRII